jgi:hypothetical protein
MLPSTIGFKSRPPQRPSRIEPSGRGTTSAEPMDDERLGSVRVMLFHNGAKCELLGHFGHPVSRFSCAGKGLRIDSIGAVIMPPTMGAAILRMTACL